MEEEKRRRQEEKERRKLEWWEEQGYTSLKLKDDDQEEEEEEEEEEREEREIQYLIGDVTQPQNTSTNDAIIVHCVGKETNQQYCVHVHCMYICTCIMDVMI